MARKPFVDPNPTLPRRKLYGPTAASPKAVPEAMAAPKRPQIGRKPAVALIEARPVDNKAKSSASVAKAPKMSRVNAAALMASNDACYRWPDDTAEHKALRAAFVAGAEAVAACDWSAVGDSVGDSPRPTDSPPGGDSPPATDSPLDRAAARLTVSLSKEAFDGLDRMRGKKLSRAELARLILEKAFR